MIFASIFRYLHKQLPRFFSRGFQHSYCQAKAKVQGPSRTYIQHTFQPIVPALSLNLTGNTFKRWKDWHCRGATTRGSGTEDTSSSERKGSTESNCRGKEAKRRSRYEDTSSSKRKGSTSCNGREQQRTASEQESSAKAKSTAKGQDSSRCHGRAEETAQQEGNAGQGGKHK
jgi:hypothetical protein